MKEVSKSPSAFGFGDVAQAPKKISKTDGQFESEFETNAEKAFQIQKKKADALQLKTFEVLRDLP